MKKFADRKYAPLCWLACHLLLVILALCFSPLKVNQNLFSVLPSTTSLGDVEPAERELSERTMSQVSIFVGHPSFDVAKSAADSLYKFFGQDSAFESFRLQVGDGDISAVREFIYSHRYSLQGTDFPSLLDSGTTTLEDEAMQRAFGAFTLSDLSHVEEDPFLLGERAFDRLTLHSPLIPKNLTMRDGYMVAQDSGLYYIFISGKLSPKVSSFASDDHVLARLNTRIENLKQEMPGLIVAKSGVPFHSFESSANAKREITWISTASMLAILILLLYVFRSPLPIVATIGSLCVALVASLSCTWLVFKEIHIFTFIFGTTVIGIGIDYSVHFWTHEVFTRENARKTIFKSLTLGFVTTALSYIALCMSAFPLLQQMAVFAMTGLASAYLTTNWMYPWISEKLGVQQKSLQKGKTPPLFIPEKFSSFYARVKSLPRTVRLVALVIFLAVLVPGLSSLNLSTDLRSLYKMSQEMLHSEMVSNRILDFGSSGFHFVVKGSSAEEVLQSEEKLAAELSRLVADSALKNFMATASYVPSVEAQQKSIQAARRELPQCGSSKNLLQAFGAKSDSLFVNSLSILPMVSPESELPAQWKEILNSLWMGKVGDSYYSIVLPLHVKNLEAVQAAASVAPNIYAVDKMGEINASLTHLSKIALWLVLGAYAVIFILLSFVYKPAGAFRILRAPLFASVLTAAIFGYGGIPFNIFSVSGVILILGIGIDYALFFREGKSHVSITTLAVLVSALTTIFSFGTLSLSGFNPVFTFGLAVFMGIMGSLLFAPLSSSAAKD